MIVDARALSEEAMIKLAQTGTLLVPYQITNENAIQSHDLAVVISIRDKTMSKFFTDSETCCVVEFADIEPMNPEFVPPADSEYMTDEHANKILNFIEKYHNDPRRIILFVHCRHGMCRSGAVADVAGMICGLGYWNTRRRNPQIVPNHWVQFLLYRNYFQKKK